MTDRRDINRYRDQGSRYQANRDRGDRYQSDRDGRYRSSREDAVHYRRAQKSALRQQRFWRFYIVIAAVVVVATAFGFVAAAGGPPWVPPQNRPAQVASEEAGSASPADENGESSASAEGDSQQSSAASQEPSQEELEQRAADFAVDPSRTDWNFSTNGRKTVYLTIDDGPSENTQAVLDILDRYGCKATFFVVGHNDDYFPMIAEAFKRGHTIGLHSMTHDYATVYSSTDAFYEDLAQIGEVVKNQIGFVPCFIRFPGGSSNDISASYCEGIMTELTESVQAKGYQYYDWNLSVGDGSEHTADEIAEYGMADEGNDNIMLLCHDSATKQSTVEALPRIIEHYQSLGYTFEAIDRNSWVCHHGVSN